MASEYIVPLPWQTPPLNLNDRYTNRIAYAGKIAAVREDTGWVIKAAKVPACDRIRVTLHYRPRDARRRDEDNLVATMKPCCDAIVDVGIVDDDTPRFMVKVMPVIHEPGEPHGLWLTIEPLADREEVVA